MPSMITRVTYSSELQQSGSPTVTSSAHTLELLQASCPCALGGRFDKPRNSLLLAPLRYGDIGLLRLKLSHILCLGRTVSI